MEPTLTNLSNNLLVAMQNGVESMFAQAFASSYEAYRNPFEANEVAYWEVIAPLLDGYPGETDYEGVV